MRYTLGTLLLSLVFGLAACGELEQSGPGVGGKGDTLAGVDGIDSEPRVSCRAHVPTQQEVDSIAGLTHKEPRDVWDQLYRTEEQCHGTCEAARDHYYPQLCWIAYLEGGCDVRCSDERFPAMEASINQCRSIDPEGTRSCGRWCTTPRGEIQLPKAQGINTLCHWPASGGTVIYGRVR